MLPPSAPALPSTPLHRSSRVSSPPDRYGFSSQMTGTNTSALSSTLSFIAIPTGYSQAVKEQCWQRAIREEIYALEANKTWDVVDCPTGVTPLGCKWVYSIKVKADGSLDMYKARSVAFENNQEYGVNYEETFAGQNDHHLHNVGYCSFSKLGFTPNGCEERPSSWGSQGRCLFLQVYFPHLLLQCVSCITSYTVSNKLLVHSMRNLLLPYSSLLF